MLAIFDEVVGAVNLWRQELRWTCQHHIAEMGGDVLLISIFRGATANGTEQTAAKSSTALAIELENVRLFQSYFMGGFEGSSHRRHDGYQLDLLAMTRHDELVGLDYRMMSAC